MTRSLAGAGSHLAQVQFREGLGEALPVQDAWPTW